MDKSCRTPTSIAHVYDLGEKFNTFSTAIISVNFYDSLESYVCLQGLLRFFFLSHNHPKKCTAAFQVPLLDQILVFLELQAEWKQPNATTLGPQLFSQ